MSRNLFLTAILKLIISENNGMWLGLVEYTQQCALLSVFPPIQFECKHIQKVVNQVITLTVLLKRSIKIPNPGIMKWLRRYLAYLIGKM